MKGVKILPKPKSKPPLLTRASFRDNNTDPPSKHQSASTSSKKGHLHQHQHQYHHQQQQQQQQRQLLRSEGSNWSIDKWLASLPVLSILADALRQGLGGAVPLADGDDPFALGTNSPPPASAHQDRDYACMVACDDGC